MIIFRYLAKEILFTLMAVSGVLLLIFMSGTFVRYLSAAAAGDLSPQALLVIMGYRLPGFLELILPLGTFIGVLLAYGRLYVESEMVVLSACGLSQRRLLGYTLLAASPVIIAVSVLSLYLSPKGVAAVETLMAEQRSRGEFELIMPEQFQPLNKGNATFYTEHISEDKADLSQVFIADKSTSSVVTGGESAVVRAVGARQWFDENFQRRYFVLDDGKRYSGIAGNLDYHEVSFTSFGQLMESNLRQAQVRYRVDAEPTANLINSSEPLLIAGLQWRLSLPILVVVVCLLAVPLSRTSPRQGRYLGMIPAILLYIIYLVALNAARDQVKLAKLDPALGLWVVHGVFFGLALLLFNWGNVRRWWKHRASAEVQAHA
ncbi:LPS export ABC transporter permease LptF [Simiduia aestuariiviva]|uniref:Lipopolysaccharide export system permease protein LptF n=1 Tax=Simiduia aestuariiviva TaxID=1510459 RepID=A0A839UR62_9GAMM|nr:lipopolysaccharide export system permease protein [Simiduia aestuariiviva]